MGVHSMIKVRRLLGAPLAAASLSLGVALGGTVALPGTALALLTGPGALGDDWRSRVEMLGARAVHPAQAGLSRDRVEEIRALGYGVNVWTVNTRERAVELFDWGATGVFTDRVHELGGLDGGGDRAAETTAGKR